jgi:hypothetical protein
MGPATISYWRSQYLGLSGSDDYALTERLSKKSYTGCSAIIQFMSSQDRPYDNLLLDGRS